MVKNTIKTDSNGVIKSLILTSNQGIPAIIQDHDNFAILTIASGKKGQTMLLHSFASLPTNGGPKKHMIFKGMGHHANFIYFKIDSAFAMSHTITIPDPNFILNKILGDNSTNYQIASNNQSD